MNRPSFLVIGAMKCGTTSLWRYLRAHPDVVTAGDKELHFFSRRWDEGWDWYLDQFPDAQAAAVGEASPSYAELHYFPDVPERIAAHLPDVRLIYLVRDPIERLVSHYLHNLDRGFERAPLAEAALATPTYTGIGMYASHVAAYLERFPRRQLLVLRSERLRDDRLAALDEVATFLGITPTWPHVDAEHGQRLTLARRLRRDVRRQGRLAAVRAVRTHRRHQRMAALPDALRAQLVDVFAPEVHAMRAHLDPAFDGWGIA